MRILYVHWFQNKQNIEHGDVSEHSTCSVSSIEKVKKSDVAICNKETGINEKKFSKSESVDVTYDNTKNSRNNELRHESFTCAVCFKTFPGQYGYANFNQCLN